ncbi:hypothetical protein [Rhodanobacter sp. L36]|uniref:EF-hand domain-containing protein n=1 Tax=Rhodanobacter sp. L36 TaxID=1747221 RepID=UPI00131A779B|nr:hypothetical protein [Rhodanobacter sp. L36]
MSMTWRKMNLMLCMTMMPIAANALQTQPRSSTTPVKAPMTSASSQASGPNALFTQWDTNHDGTLSPAEFSAGWEKLQSDAALHRLHDQFVALDTNKSGSLDAAEYAHLELIKHAGASAPPMSAFDTDKNRRLDFKEYVNAVGYMLQHEQKK